MKFEKPIFMGHSMGAATVMRVGAEYPDLAKAIIMLDPGLGRGGPPAASTAGPPRAPASPPAVASSAAPTAASAPDRLSVGMRGTPEVLVAQNNYRFEDLVATCRRQTPKWDLVDCQYWALSKKQYHGSYTDQTWQAMSGTMRTGDALAKIPVPALILKADAAPDARKTHAEAASVMPKGKLVHIDEAGHNLHHDQPINGRDYTALARLTPASCRGRGRHDRERENVPGGGLLLLALITPASAGGEAGRRFYVGVLRTRTSATARPGRSSSKNARCRVPHSTPAAASKGLI